jgi:hypothetical protein
MSDRFDLEQQILSCWNVVDDIKTLIEQRQTGGELNEEQLINYLRGLEAIYQVKFNKMFDTFEKCISVGIFKKTVTDDQ